jgi:hypothetical protein
VVCCPHHLKRSSSEHYLCFYFQHKGIDFEFETLPKLEPGGVRGNATSTEQPHLTYPSASNDADVPLTVCNTLSATYQPSTGQTPGSLLPAKTNRQIAQTRQIASRPAKQLACIRADMDYIHVSVGLLGNGPSTQPGPGLGGFRRLWARGLRGQESHRVSL